MANFNSRPNNLEYSSRLSPAISHTTFTNSQTRDVSFKRKYSGIKRRNIKTSVKRGHSPCQFYQRSFLQRLFLVLKKGGDLRPVIDLSALNQLIINEHFQMENISCLKQILNQNDFMVKLDLKDAYLTVGVHEQSQHYLRFIWQGQAYQFQALPFGLCTSPRVFTKLLKPVITFLRTRNIRLLIYLDDILIVSSNIKTLKEQTGQILDLLQSLGFINFEKSVLTPVMEFLGQKQ